MKGALGAPEHRFAAGTSLIRGHEFPLTLLRKEVHFRLFEYVCGILAIASVGRMHRSRCDGNILRFVEGFVPDGRHKMHWVRVLRWIVHGQPSLALVGGFQNRIAVTIVEWYQ